MSFVTNTRTRRTKRACTHNTSYKDILMSNGAPPIDDTRFNRGLQQAVRNQTAETTTIGSQNSRGLVILGGAVADSFQYPTDANGNVPPMLEVVDEDHNLPHNQLAKPAFPITYSGPGHLAFQSGFEVPYIIGSTEIKGNLVVHGSLTVTNVFGPDAGSFSPVIQDALGNGLDGVVAQASYKLIDFGDYFECCIQWTNNTLIDPLEEMRLTGFPATYYSSLSRGTVHVDYGIVTTGIGMQLECRTVPGLDYLEFYEVDNSNPEPNVNVLGSAFNTAGDICIRGLLTKV